MIDPDLEGSARKMLTEVGVPEEYHDEMVAALVERAAPLKDPPTGDLEVAFHPSQSGTTQVPGHTTVIEMGPACCLWDMAQAQPVITHKFEIDVWLN